MIFLSPHAGLNFNVRGPKYYTDPNTGFREMTRPQVDVDFLDPSVAASGMDADGNGWNTVRGGSFDTDEAAARLGWEPDEKLQVEQTLLAMAKDPKQPVTLWEPAAPETPFDLTPDEYTALHPNRVLALASELNKLAECLAWEQHALDRPEIVKALQAKVAAREEQAKADEALTAA